MTLLDLFRPRTVPVGGPVRGPVEIPAYPVNVLIEAYDKYTTVHDADSDAVTRCGLSLLHFGCFALAMVGDLDPHFCDDCWPGRRCAICRVPSGGSVQCARCVTVSIDTDKRIERAA